MNREQYIAQLRKSLGRIHDEEKREILADYEEHFQAGVGEGRSEEEIAKALGSPSALGATYRIEDFVDKGRSGWKPADVVRAAFASVSLGLFNVIFVLGPFAGLLGALAGLWAAAGSIALAGAAGVLAAIASPFLPWFAGMTLALALVSFFAGIGVAALGFLAIIGMAYATRWLFTLTARYIGFNARIITGKKHGE